MTNLEVEALLSNWSEWVGRDCDGGLGFPTKTILGRMSDGDISMGSSSKSTAPPLMKRDYRAETVNRAITKLSKVDPVAVDAIVLQYCGAGTSTQKSKELLVSKRTYYTLIERGKCWLSGFFSAIQNQSDPSSSNLRLSEDKGVGKNF